MRFLNLARLQSKCDDNAVNSSEDLEQKSRKTIGYCKKELIDGMPFSQMVYKFTYRSV